MLEQDIHDDSLKIGSEKNVRDNGTVHSRLVGIYGGVVSGIVTYTNVPDVKVGTYLNFTERRWRGFSDPGLAIEEKEYVELTPIRRREEEVITSEEQPNGVVTEAEPPKESERIEKSLFEIIQRVFTDDSKIQVTPYDFTETKFGVRISPYGLSRGVRFTEFQKSLLEETGVTML